LRPKASENMIFSEVFAYFSSISPVFKSWHGSGYSNRHAQRGAGQVQMKGDKMMTTMQARIRAIKLIVKLYRETYPEKTYAELREDIRMSIQSFFAV
jgi:hypothetical protein